MRLGFIGTGAIAKAVVTGLLDGDAADLEVTVSPRNAAIAADLAARFPERLRVAASNQEVLDASEVAVIAVLPRLAREVLGDLRFRADHAVLSLVAALSVEEIAPLVSPATRIVRAIPLPSAAEKASPTPIMPPDPIAREIFGRTGVAIETADRRAFDAMAAASGVMAGHFAAAGTVADWLADKGLAGEQAEAYVRLLLAGLAGTASSGRSSFAELAKEHTTEGGLNAQFLAHLGERGAFETVRTGLDGLLARIEAAARA